MLIEIAPGRQLTGVGGETALDIGAHIGGRAREGTGEGGLAGRKCAISGVGGLGGRRAWRWKSELVEPFTQAVLEGHDGWMGRGLSTCSPQSPRTLYGHSAPSNSPESLNGSVAMITSWDSCNRTGTRSGQTGLGEYQEVGLVGDGEMGTAVNTRSIQAMRVFYRSLRVLGIWIGLGEKKELAINQRGHS